ncbi:MAG: proline--tRNA ligase [Candidatus Hydrogenedentota bacterium]|nr:MAG: proline--tRNA ligase [Candidatus Hydrogenedentota bacterium]
MIQRLSRYFLPTLREDPAEAELPSHRLLVRGGFIRPVGSGIYSLLPLGQRLVARVEGILREEMNRAGGLEVSLPVTQPAELWKESGRWDAVGPEMLRFRDRGGRDMCLAMTHEETIVDLVRRDVKSYRQLPLLLYQIQTKFRDEPRSRGGLIRVREFTMKDAYSFHDSEDSLEEYYRRMYDTYERIFERCGLETIVVESDPGMMGGKIAHEFIAPSPFGEDTVIRCSSCNYSANRQVARFRRETPPSEDCLPLEEVATPNCETIEEVAAFLGVPKSRTAKAVFFHGKKTGLVFGILRGDYEVNETLLAAALKEPNLRPAHPEEILASGAVPGYASPIGVRGATVVADPSVVEVPNLVSGANREGFHLKNVNCPRDFQPDLVAEIAAADAGLACVECGHQLEAVRGIEVGNIFKLGTRYSAAMNACYQDASGKEHPFIMGCYGIGSGRVAATIVEQHHDKDGILFPLSVAPFSLIVVPAKPGAEPEAEEKVENTLKSLAAEVLWDDRDLRAGVRFKDADLIGIPYRITIGRRAKDGIVEIRKRDTGEVEEVSFENLGDHIATLLRD